MKGKIAMRDDLMNVTGYEASERVVAYLHGNGQSKDRCETT